MGKVAYLGPAKTFTEAAAIKLVGDKCELVPIQPIRSVINAIEIGAVEYGVVPLENIYMGPVLQTVDSLRRCEKPKIVAETSLKIVHCLGALPGHRKIEQILSKDQALEQCEAYLCDNYPDAQTIATASTAEAADYIAKTSSSNGAAIANEAALAKSGLEILAKDLCPNNRTRFVLLGREPMFRKGDDKTMLVIHPPIRDKPGVLRDCLDIFGSQHINLECVYSRPDGKKGYFFYVELDGHESDPNVETALKAIRLSLDPKTAHHDTIKILGSFPNSHWKDAD